MKSNKTLFQNDIRTKISNNIDSMNQSYQKKVGYQELYHIYTQVDFQV